MTREGVQLNTFEEAFRYATAVVRSGLAPKGDNAEAVVVKLQIGAELGLTPMRALAGVVVVNGKPTLEGHLALGLIRSKGYPVEVFAEGEGDNRRGVFVSKRDGKDIRVEFSLADAKRAGLASKETYKSYLDDMLIWKAVSRASKRYFSDVINGLDVAEHVADYTRANVERVAAPALPPPESPDPIMELLPPSRVEIDPETGQPVEDPPQGKLL
jgi:hypothetical protein